MINNKGFIPLLMYMLVAFGGIMVDIIVPSLPSMRSALGASETMTQWAFTAAMLGFGLGQLIAGFVVDAYGRKKPMLIGGMVLVVSLMLTMMMSSMQAVIGLRLLQGLSVSFVCVGGRAVVKDLFHGDAYLKAINWLTISFAMGITLSPFVGGYIETLFGWQMVFIFLAVWVSIGCVLLWLFFEETHLNREPLHLSTMKANLSDILLNKNFQYIALACGIFYSILPTFNTVSSFLIQETLGYSPVFYGYLALALGGCWLIGNITNHFLFHITAMRKTVVSLGLSLLAVLLGIGYQFEFGLNIYAFIAPIGLIIFSLGMLFPLYLGHALGPFSHIAGIANALVFSVCWLCTALISLLASSLPLDSGIPLMAMYLVLIVLAMGLVKKIK
ncbi:MFS transporter [Vibrio algicola]|uniref:MFS transporter n=1 Tax=Vibrio algicola TaxID=2662262 RepID=A0A5Q0TDL7_9VIBR|nr:MFS transporter [Vibrio algicola]